MNRVRLIALGWLLVGCHLASNEVAPLSCYDPVIVRCTACVDRGCAWCPSGPNPDEGYCCEPARTGTTAHCPAPITAQAQCAVTPPCDDVTVNTCGDCLGRGCGWCPDESRCHSRQQDGTFPACASSQPPISGQTSCPP